MSSSYDDELIKDLELNKLSTKVEVVENIEYYLNLLEQKFQFNGSRIDWSQIDRHMSEELNDEYLLAGLRQFISKIKENHLIDKEVELIYFGDSLTEYGYKFELRDIEQIIVHLLEIPQHHYFVPVQGDWCLCVSYEYYIDFGFSLKE